MVEAEGITIALDAAERLTQAAAEEQRLAERLRDGERRRFTLGSSDFFLVNQRKETATDAQVQLIDAHAANRGGSRRIGCGDCRPSRSRA